MVDLVEIQAAYYLIAATGVLIAAIYYVVNTRTTLQTRQAQLFMPIYANFYSEDFIKAEQETLYQWQWSDYDDYQSKYGYSSNSEAGIMRYKVGAYLEGIGVLVQRRLIDPSLVDDLMSGTITLYWEKFGPIIIEMRKRLNYPQAGEHIEYLYNQIKPIVDKQHPELRK